MAGIKAKISETMDKLTHRSGTNANTGHGTGHTTGSSGYTSGNTGDLNTTGTTGYNTTSGTTGMGTTGTGMGTGMGTGSEYTTTGTTDYGTTGTTGGMTTGGMTTGTTTSMGTGQVIDSEVFTKTEDHEVLVEKKRYELEHHPVEKKYVVETKYVGETQVAGAPTEVVGNESNIVDERIKQAPAGDRTVVVENVDIGVPASQMRGQTTTTTGMGQQGMGQSGMGGGRTY